MLLTLVGRRFTHCFYPYALPASCVGGVHFRAAKSTSSGITSQKLQQTYSVLERRQATNTKAPPIVIVGGGPTGLLLSLLLSEYAVPSIVVEAQAPDVRFRHPQAHFLNTRTMEILKHSLPSVYQKVVNAMPPVEHWQSFRFGASVRESVSPLAEVVHPVSRPLQANCDANGKLLQGTASSINENMNTDSNYRRTTETTTADLSPCTVGHLAQHTFGRILYDEALLRDNIISIRYGMRVQSIDVSSPSARAVPAKSGTVTSLWRIAACSEVNNHPTATFFETDICVAADGANSTIRNLLEIEVTPTTERTVLQHLINIHVQLSRDIAMTLLHQRDNYAMLYSVYTPKAVAVVVCHSIGEYIIQIPYFPPYQTVEDNFGPDQITIILRAIFGSIDIMNHCKVLSVKPWTMNACVANHYYHSLSTTDQLGVLLAGDAAHVFPPAGGLGMNTGLQDVHNMAWKLAVYRRLQNTEAEPANSSDDAKSSLVRLMESYDSERRPVAHQNAALSVRNYQRMLLVMQSLYLNEQHPALVQSFLDQSPLPLSVRQNMFRSLLQTALYPFIWLQDPQSLYAQHIRSNLRSILETGAGLPLLFPRYEIGFSYSPPGPRGGGEVPISDDSSAQWSNDTLPVEPALEVGRLLPHVHVQVISGVPFYNRLQPLDEVTTSDIAFISTTDLPSQMRQGSDPTFVLLWVKRNEFVQQEMYNVCINLSHRIGVPVELAVLLQAPDRENDIETHRHLVLIECTERSQSFSFFQQSNETSRNCEESYAALIRPDGHVAAIENVSSLTLGGVTRLGLEQTLSDSLYHQIKQVLW